MYGVCGVCGVYGVCGVCGVCVVCVRACESLCVLHRHIITNSYVVKRQVCGKVYFNLCLP